MRNRIFLVFLLGLMALGGYMLLDNSNQQKSNPTLNNIILPNASVSIQDKKDFESNKVYRGKSETDSESQPESGDLIVSSSNTANADMLLSSRRKSGVDVANKRSAVAYTRQNKSVSNGSESQLSGSALFASSRSRRAASDDNALAINSGSISGNNITPPMMAANDDGVIIVDPGGDPDPDSMIPVGEGIGFLLILVGFYTTVLFVRRK